MRAVSLRILFVLRVLCLASPAGGQPKAPLKCSKVCGSFTSVILEKRIKSYRRTEPQCTKQAVIFTTQRLLEICADPEAEWVKKIVWKLDQKKASAALPLPRAATTAAGPEKPGVFHKHIGLQETAPSQATAAATTVMERTHVPAARTSTAAMQSTTQFSAGSAPVAPDIAAPSGVSSEASRDPLTSPAHSTTAAAGMATSQPGLHPTAGVHGFESTEEPVGYAADATADAQDMTSSSHPDPASLTEGSEHPGLSTDGSLGSTSARGNAASGGFGSGLPSTLSSVEIGTVPATPVPPDTTSVPTPNPTAAVSEGPSVHNRSVSSSADASGTRTCGCLSPLGKDDLPDTPLFTSQAFSGRGRAQMATGSPGDPPSPSFLSRPEAHLVIPVSLVGGLIACSVAAVWLYTKFRARAAAVPTEAVQVLLYRKEGPQNDVYAMEV